MTACPNWLELLKSGASPIPPLELDEDAAATAVRAYETLRLPDVPGQPKFKDAGGRWGRDLVRSVFGTVRRNDDGLVVGRTYRKFFVLVPKKNAKTTNGAGIMLVALLLNQRPNAEFLLIGPTQKIADTAFDAIVGMINADPGGWLSKLFHIRDHKKTIVHRVTKAKLSIKTFDTKVVTGAKPVGVLIDELHELGKIPYAEKVLTQLRGGIIANPEGFLIYITTQSDSPPAGVFKTELDYARSIRDGEIEGDLLPILYEFPFDMQTDEKEPWRDPANWHLVLPNLGKSITLDVLKSEYKEAAAKGIDNLSIWASQHLNVQIGIALHADRWAGTKYWPLARDPEQITVESLIERSEVVTVGVDGGGLDDLLGLALCGRDKITKDWLFWFRAWAHPDALEQRKQNQAQYSQFQKDGDLVICADATQDIEELVEIIGKVFDAGLLPEKHAIGLDPVGVAAITDALATRGIDPEQMSAIGQGYRLSGTIKGMERKLKDGTLWHDGSGLMTWCVGNAKAELKGSALLITKEVAGKAKIDPLIAGFNAFALMARNPSAGTGPSIYRGRGLLTA
jgi:phage terminase large subunit-like protein